MKVGFSMRVGISGVGRNLQEGWNPVDGLDCY